MEKRKPRYEHWEFVTDKKADIDIVNNKRYWLELTINENFIEKIIVILKNPSRATLEESDKTVNTVVQYVNKNREKYSELNKIGKIVILNLMPFYEPYSNKLQGIKSVFDEKNMDILNKFCSKNKKVIIAWGNHPSGLFHEYQEIKAKVLEILVKNKNEVFFVRKENNSILLFNKNPLHGQVWGYEYKFFKYNLL